MGVRTVLLTSSFISSPTHLLFKELSAPATCKTLSQVAGIQQGPKVTSCPLGADIPAEKRSIRSKELTNVTNPNPNSNPSECSGEQTHMRGQRVTGQRGAGDTGSLTHCTGIPLCTNWVPGPVLWHWGQMTIKELVQPLPPWSL